MRQRFTICMLTGALFAMVGTAPAAAQSFDGEVLLSQPSADEVCDLIGGLGEELGGEEGLGALEEMLSGVEGLAGFEPESVDGAEYADLGDALQTIMDDNDGAMGVTASTDGQALIVTIAPDVSSCESLEGLDVDEQQLEAGTYLIAPSTEEFCGLIEDTLSELDEETLGGGADGGGDGATGEGGGELGGSIEGLLPEPVGDEDRGTYDAVGAALTDLLDGSDDASQASASLQGESLVVSLVPDVTDCEGLAGEESPGDAAPEDAPEDIEAPSEVPSGLGVSDSGPSVPALLAGLGLLLLAVGVRSLRTSRG